MTGSKGGQTKILDFGLAKLMEPPYRVGGERADGSDAAINAPIVEFVLYFPRLVWCQTQGDEGEAISKDTL